MNLALVEIVKREFNEALFTVLGRFPESATPNDLYLALALAARRELLRRSVRTSETYYRKASRTVVLPVGRVPARARTSATTS